MSADAHLATLFLVFGCSVGAIVVLRVYLTIEERRARARTQRVVHELR